MNPTTPLEGMPELPAITAYHCGDWRLPERTVPLYVDAQFTADQMREFGLRCYEAGRESAAKECDRLGGDHFATAIRNL